jgi:nicotinate-nucleotide adenylyltransferase
MTRRTLPSTIAVSNSLLRPFIDQLIYFMLNTSNSNSNNNSNQPFKPAIRAYLGGSFDPVHNAHIQMAMQVYDCLAPIAAEQQRLLQITLLPNARSPFKQQTISPAQRLAMLKFAVHNTPLQISELELWQTPPVYSIDSVRALRQRYPNDSLIFIMGMDSARSLGDWKNGLQLTDYVHLWIFDRHKTADALPAQQLTHKNLPANNLAITTHKVTSLSNELPVQLQAQLTDSLMDLVQPFANSLEDALKNTLTASSTATFDDGKPLSDAKKISEQHAKQGSKQNSERLPNNSLLKTEAQGRIYIDQRQVATVSSTYIRQQIAQQRHKPLATDLIGTNSASNYLVNLLNPTVYQYIIAHQLYSAV